jgi:hypothetical protein
MHSKSGKSIFPAFSGNQSRTVFARPIILGLLFLLPLSEALAAKRDNLKVTTIQNLSFGSFFSLGTGGTITINPDGTRTATGGIILNNMSASSPATFEVEGPINTYVYIQNGPNVTLRGGGGTVSLTIGSSDLASPILLKKKTANKDIGMEQVNIGATLIVDTYKKSPEGYYTGSFYVTFIQQ